MLKSCDTALENRNNSPRRGSRTLKTGVAGAEVTRVVLDDEGQPSEAISDACTQCSG